MKMPCELIAEPYIANVRQKTAINLSKLGYTQSEIASILRVSQALVSSYLRKKQKIKLDLDNKEVKMIDQSAKLVAQEVTEILILSEKNSVEKAIQKVCEKCKELRISGPTCVLHSKIVSGLNTGGAPCTACITTEHQIQLLTEERFTIIQSLGKIIRSLDQLSILPAIVPEIGLQMIYGTSDMQSELDVSAFPGRITKYRGHLTRIPSPEFGASEGTARLLLTVHQFFEHLRAAITLKFSNMLLISLKGLVTEIKANIDTMSLKAISKVFNLLGDSSKPILIYSEPILGLEQIAYLICDSPEDIFNLLSPLEMNE